MKRLALVALSTVFCGCAAHATATWVEPSARVTVVAPPPPPPPGVVVEAQVQPASVEVDVAPAPEATAEPEELIATSEPPELVYEEQTDMPGPGVFWVPGYWQWTGSDWGWYYGAWAPAPAGRVYIEPYYEHVNGHVVFVRGYWGAQGEAPRYYGGDRITFTAAVRPANYQRGVRVAVPRSAGLPPGQRGHYGPKPTGVFKKRPLPTASAPRVAVAMHAEPVSAHASATVHGEVHGTAEAHGTAEGTAKPTGKTEVRGQTTSEPKPQGNEQRPQLNEARPQSNEAKPEPRPQTAPQAKPEPRPQPAPAAKPGPKRK